MSPRTTPVDLGPIVRAQVEALGIPVVGEVLEERARQDAQWGEQNHPDLRPGLAAYLDVPPGALDGLDVAEYYGLPTSAEAKQLTDTTAREGNCSWVAIATEELAEAVEAAADGDVAALRTEVIQLAAVCVQWVQAIDRRTTGGATS